MADQDSSRNLAGVAAVTLAVLAGGAGAWAWAHRHPPSGPPAPAPQIEERRGKVRRGPADAAVGTIDPIVPPEQLPPAGAPSVLVLTLDTTRADHLGSYGYFRDTSPAIDAIAKESVLFERYTVPMSITLPSHMTVFTGTFPDEHGIVANIAHGGKRFVPSPKLETFAQYLGSVGYVTAGFVSSSPLKKYTGVNQGFQSFYEPDGEARHARETTDLALQWIAAAPDRPFLLWVHYFDPHWPYGAPGRNADVMRGVKSAEQDSWLAERQAIPSDLSPDKVKTKIDKYDGEIFYMDQNIGRLVQALKDKGVWDDLVVVVVGDHGEGLMQHSYPSHGHVWTEQIAPPFLLKAPGLPPGRSAEPVSGVDVTATVLGQLDLPDEDRYLAQVTGHDVLAPGHEVRPVYFRTSEVQHDKATDTKFAKPITWGVADADWIYQRTDAAVTPAATCGQPIGVQELFARATDPYELHSVAAEHADVVARLDALVEADCAREAKRREELGAGKLEDLTDEQKAALEALGYVDGEEPQGVEDEPPPHKKAPRTP